MLRDKILKIVAGVNNIDGVQESTDQLLALFNSNLKEEREEAQKQFGMYLGMKDFQINNIITELTLEVKEKGKS